LDAPASLDTKKRPIGVFDSGIGGLSVLRALRAELPNEHFIYVGDAGYAPYGERDDAHVITRSHAVARHLLGAHHIKALVVACNTATAAAIQQLRQAHPDLPIVGIEPALKPAVASSRTRLIGVMATRGTLNSEKFRTLLNSLHGQATFVLQPCDGLATAIERADAIEIGAACAYFTGAMGQFGLQTSEIDTLVLGCTHYPYVSDTLASLVGSDIALLEGGAPVARQTRRLLTVREQLVEPNPLERPATVPLDFYTTGSATNLQNAIQRWLHIQTEVQSITME
jgi:glutamate racemase